LKKDEFQFTIRFDKRFDEHKKVADFLNSVGRKKASIIAEAIIDYMEKHKSHDDKPAQMSKVIKPNVDDKKPAKVTDNNKKTVEDIKEKPKQTSTIEETVTEDDIFDSKKEEVVEEPITTKEQTFGGFTSNTSSLDDDDLLLSAIDSIETSTGEDDEGFF